MSFAYPYVLMAPVVLLFFLKNKKSSGIPYPSSSLLLSLPKSLKIRLRTPVLSSLLLLFIVCLTLAAARPQNVSSLESPQKAHDLILALDISGSMKEEDFSSGFRTINRLNAVKLVVSEFIEKRKGDRIGIVVFGTKAFLQAPLTTDHNLLLQLLDLLQIGIAGEGTAIGDGLGLSLKRLKDIDGDSKAIILLTDGANNSGDVNPLQASKIAQKLGIKVHTIGIGSSKSSGRQRFFGNAPEYDEATLKTISETTGGIYFNAQDMEGLKQVYSEIDLLEQREDEKPERIVVREYYPDFALAALILLILYFVLKNTIFLKLSGVAA